MRRLVLFATVLLVASCFVGGAAAQAGPRIRVTITPLYDEVTLDPGKSGSDPLTVEVEFLNGACTADARVPLSLVFGRPFPSWAGASINPMNLEFRHPGESKPSSLGIIPAEDAPRGGTATYEILAQVREPSAGSCPEPISIEAPARNVTLRITGAEDGADGNGNGGDGSSPGLEGWLGGASILGAAWALRRARLRP